MIWFLFFVGTVASFCYVLYDHNETWLQFKNANRGKAKFSAAIKLILLWFIPVVGTTGSCMSMRSGDATDARIEAQSTEIGNLKKVTTTRNLEASRLSEMLRELEGVSKLTVEIHFPIGDVEAEELAHQIGDLLDKARISVRGGPMVGFKGPRGVTVNHGKDATSSALAVAIAKAISIGGIAASALPEPGSDGQTTISIGRKP